MAKAKSPRGKKQSDATINSTPASTPLEATPAGITQAEAVQPASAIITSAKLEPSQFEATKMAKKTLEMVRNDSRTESRTNVVPINLDDEIRRRAYELSERRGFESGHEHEDWLRAEREVRQRYQHQQQSA